MMTPATDCVRVVVQSVAARVRVRTDIATSHKVYYMPACSGERTCGHMCELDMCAHIMSVNEAHTY